MRVTIPVLMLIITPAWLGAQQAQVGTSAAASATASTTASSLVATDDAAANVRIEDAIARVQAAGLSSASLVSRARLGSARAVSATRIALAVEQRADALLEARGIVRANGSLHTATTIELAADAIEGGASASHVASVVAGFEGAEQSRALAALGVLAAEGRLGADVMTSVRAALDAGLGAGTTTAVNGVAGASADGAGVAGSAAGTANSAAALGGATTSTGATASGVVRGALQR